MSRLFRRSQIACLRILLVLPVIASGCGELRGGPLVALEVETEENTLDGCTACGCRAKGELEPGVEHLWWISFGLITADAETGWEAAAPSSHCGSGSFEKAASGFRRTLGIPYVILHLSTTAAVPPAGEVNLETQLRIQKLSGFDPNGEPVYARSMQQRMLSFASEGEITLPLLIPDQREKKSFGVHEVLVRLRAKVLGREPAASYGIISVSADVPGAEILLDGGFVGRIAEGNPTVLKNVLAGTREICVRDFSGREARRQLVVEKDGAVEVALNVLDLTAAGPRHDLVPIGKNPQGYQESWRVRDGAVVVRIPAGEFLMGSPEGQGEPDERPQHRVYVSEFLIDKTEITWRQFRKFAEAKGSPLPPAPAWGTPDDYPAAFVLWEEAQSYCEWVGGRLPTEAEWEKAARGTDGRKYSWGNEWEPQRCNSISGGLHRPESVGSYPGCVSPYGVLDMPGSMWEWCADRYGESYYAESPSRNPKGPTSGRLRVMRGGAWMSQPLWLRAAYRFKASPSSRNNDHGFRCAHDALEPVR
jgi:formylglycine-generating enzyme required for sulfatase activity